MNPDGYQARIESILREIWAEIGDKPIDPDVPLLQLGVDSILLVTLLGRAEEELDLEWDPGTSPSEFETLRSIADLAARCASHEAGTHEDYPADA